VKVALIHDWLVTYRGGEKVLEAIAELFPSAEVFTLFHEPGSTSQAIESRVIHTSFLDKIPLARRRYRHLLPLLPKAIESLSLDGFDLIVSSSHCVAKGVKKSKGARHISYVHAPMRYMWDRFDDYFGPKRASWPVRAAAHAIRPYLKAWDKKSAAGVDLFIANSHFIASKISEFYGRTSEVIHPTVELHRFASTSLEGTGQGNYFLWLGALAPYKRADLAIEAFRQSGLPLWVAGDGQEAKSLSRNLPANVKMLGRVSDDELPSLYRNARAFVFTGEEDFGLTPIEALTSGRPVIAFARGGALETVTPQTGIFFHSQTTQSLNEAISSFDAFEKAFRPEDARAQALKFSKQAFQQRFLQQVEKAKSLI